MATQLTAQEAKDAIRLASLVGSEGPVFDADAGWDDLYVLKLITLATDPSGEGWPYITREGTAYLTALYAKVADAEPDASRDPVAGEEQ